MRSFSQIKGAQDWKRLTGIHSEHEKGITEQMHMRKVPHRILETHQNLKEIYIDLLIPSGKLGHVAGFR